MENFTYNIPTKVYFGKGMVASLLDEIPKMAKKVLLVYGGGSIKRNGAYDDVINILNKINITYFELDGVQPNPRIESVRKGVQICKEFGIDAIIAIGGGSSIDCAKVIAAGTCYERDVWDLVEDASKVKKALPIISVVTLAATGSEMDGIAVISEMDSNEKKPLKSEQIRPIISILDPIYTYSVPKYHTAAGIVDILSHLIETYFSFYEGFMLEKMNEGIQKTCIHYGLIAMNEPTNYDARANLLWASSWAINDMLKCGRPTSWSVHAMEHQLSAYYDITHGVGLAILTPNWMRFILNAKTVNKFANYAKNVWDVKENTDKYKMANEGIENLETFYKKLNIPTTLREVGIEDNRYFDEMAEKAIYFMSNCFYDLSKKDIIKIYENSL